MRLFSIFDLCVTYFVLSTVDTIINPPRSSLKPRIIDELVFVKANLWQQQFYQQGVVTMAEDCQSASKPPVSLLSNKISLYLQCSHSVFVLMYFIIQIGRNNL